MSTEGGERWWTAAEANVAIERVTEIVERARKAAARLSDRAARISAARPGNGHGGGSASIAPFNDAIRDLARDGIVLRDVEQGLVDFPALAPSGRPYWLCWVVGEPEVAWWHWPEDGFAGRTPLSKPPT